ncbi:hypothetical protein C8R43DRAFT_955783 [Mycena crocata]|nr:hypothetical protein C8R43DRAFT_955783 [Mycena crocata]
MKFSTLVSLAVIGLATIAGAAPAPGFTIHTDIIVHGDQEKLPDSRYAVSSLVEEASSDTAQCTPRGRDCWDMNVPCCPGLYCYNPAPFLQGAPVLCRSMKNAPQNS